MATDLERLTVTLEASVRKFERELAKARTTAERALRGIEADARKSQARIEASLADIGKGFREGLGRGLGAIGLGFGLGLGAREVRQLADEWTRAGNLIAAAGQVAGRAGRDLEGINQLARETRADFATTAELYARIMRATAGVAESEEQVARATVIINKAFKAGGAAASEMAAGILQLAQGLSSGVLQGDELRSVRENAPLLAQAIADYFGTTIAGLKQLGEEGKLTSDKVFQAILAAQPQIEQAFAATNMTIEDALTQVWNALTQYIGQTDASLGASRRLAAGLAALAENFDTIADAVLMIGTALGVGLAVRMVGTSKAAAALTAEVARQRAIFAVAAQIAGGYGSLLSTVATRATAAAVAMRGFSMASAALGGPVGIALTGLALAFIYAGQKTREASEYADLYAAALERVKAKAQEVGDEARGAADRLVNTEVRRIERHLQKATTDLLRARDEVVKALEREIAAGFSDGVIPPGLEGHVTSDFLAGIIGPGEEAVRVFSELLDKFRRGEIDAAALREELSRLARLGFPDLIASFDELLSQVQASAALVDDLRGRLERLNDIRVSVPDVPDLSETFGDLQKQGFVTRQIEESKKSTEQKRIEAEAQKLLNEARKEGITLQEAEALALAKTTIANEKAVKASEQRSNRKSPQERFGDELERVRDQIAMLDRERESLGLTTAEREKARKALELEIAAKRAGVPLTDEYRAKIDEVASAYGRAQDALETARQAQEDFAELQRFIGQEISSFFSDIVSGGENAEKALMNLVKRLADAALQAALLGQGPLASLFGLAGKGGKIGGVVGKVFEGFGFSSGGYTGAGGKYEPAGIVHRGEYVFDKAAVARLGVGNLEALRRGAIRGFADGGFVGMPHIPTPVQPRGGGFQVNIINNAGAEVTTRESMGPGGPRLDVMIEAAVAQSIAKGGQLDQLIRGRYGLNPMRGR